MHEQFRAAARLVNEWRDTIYYTGLASVATAVYASSGNPGEAGSVFAQGAAVREYCRAGGWLFNRTLYLAGTSARKPVHSGRFTYAALASVGAVACADFSLGQHMIAAMPFLEQALEISAYPFTGLCLSLAGGPRGYVEAYKTMWDWPRKRGGDGGGTTQTQKIKDAFAKIGQKVWGRLAPAARAALPLRSSAMVTKPATAVDTATHG